jgi:hypothetical protein
MAGLVLVLQGMRVATESSELSTTTAQIPTLETEPEVLLKLAEGAVTKILRLDFLRGFLLQCEDVLAGREFLLPGLDLFLSRECVRLHDPVYNSCDFTGILIDIIDVAFIASNTCMVVVPVGFGLRSNSYLRDLLRRFIADYNLPRPPNIQDQRMAFGSLVEVRMLIIACAAAVEAI